MQPIVCLLCNFSGVAKSSYMAIYFSGTFAIVTKRAGMNEYSIKVIRCHSFVNAIVHVGLLMMA